MKKICAISSYLVLNLGSCCLGSCPSPLILLDAQANGRGQADFLIAVADVEAVQHIGAAPHQAGIPGNRGRAGTSAW